jgi:DNA-binding MarR family transcriptional regulator
MDDSGPGLIELLTQLNKSFHKRTSEELLGMRMRQFMALSKVRDHPGISQQELAEMMILDPNGVVLLLNELEDLGYSLRRRDAGDRRRHIVELTDAGRKAVAHADKARGSIEDELLSALTDEDKATLKRILNKAIEGSTRALAATPKAS